MDYNVVTNFAGNLGVFSAAFKSYISKSEAAAKRIRAAEEKIDTYASMTVEDYYIEQRLEEKMTEPAYLAISDEKQRAAWIEYQRYQIRTNEPFENLSEARKSKYTQDFESLIDSVGNARVEAMVHVEEDKIFRQKDALVEAIDLVRRKNDVTRRKIESNLAHLSAELEDLEIDFEARVAVADMSEVDAIQADYDARKEAIQGRVDFYNSTLDLMDTFTAELDEIETRNNVVGDYFKVNFEESKAVFATIADGLVKLNEANIASDEKVDGLRTEVSKIASKVEDKKGKDFVFDLVKNTDNTFNIVMRKAGKKYTEMNVPADALTEEFVAKKMHTFAGMVATETKFTRQEILDGQVVIRLNGLVIGVDDKLKNGKYKANEVPMIVAEALGPIALTAGVPEIDTPEVEPVVEEPVVEEPVVEEPVVEEPVVEEPVVEEPVVEEPVVEEPVVEEPVVEEPVVEEPVVEEPVVEEVPADEVPEVGEDEVAREETPHVPTKAEKMAKVIKAKKTKFGRTRDMAVLAAAGLFGVSLLGAGTLPLAAIAAGVATVSSGASLWATVKEFTGKKCAYRKLNKLATSVGCKVEYDQENGKARFYQDLPTGKKYIEGHDLPEVEDVYGVDLQAELDRIFKNKCRSVANPRTLRELDYKDFPKVTVDGLEHAFDEFGGMMTKKEEMGLLYRVHSGKKEPKEFREPKEGPTFGERVSGFFDRFKRDDEELEEEAPVVDEEAPVVDEEAPVVSEVSADELEDVVGAVEEEAPVVVEEPAVVEEPVVVEDIDVPAEGGLADELEDELDFVPVTEEELGEEVARTLK